MADHPELRGKIRIEDHGSEALRLLAGEIHKVAAEAAHAGHAINHMHHEGVLNVLKEQVGELREGFGRVHESILGVHEGLTDLLPAFAAIGAIGTIGGVFEMVAAEAEKMEALGHTAAIIGITSEQLDRMHYSAKQTGTSTEAMDKGLERLNKNLALAAQGQNKLVAASLKHAHISLYDGNHQLKTAAVILPEIEAGFRRMHNAAARSAYEVQFFGKAGMELDPVLTMAADRQRDLNDEFNRFHPIGEEGRKALDKYAEGLKQVKEAGEGFKESIAASMAPILLPAENQLRDFLADQAKLAAHHQGIGGMLETEGGRVRDYLQSVDWKQVGADIEGIAHATNEVVDAFGGWGRAAEVVAGLMVLKGGLWVLSPVFAFAGAVKGVGKAVWDIAAAWRGVSEAEVAAIAVGKAGNLTSLVGAGARNAAQTAAAGLATGSAGHLARAEAEVSREGMGRRTGFGGLLMAGQIAEMAAGDHDHVATKEDYYRDPGLLKWSRDRGLDWAHFAALPARGALSQHFANWFGDRFADEGLNSLLPSFPHIFGHTDDRVRNPFVDYGAGDHGAGAHNPFANGGLDSLLPHLWDDTHPTSDDRRDAPTGGGVRNPFADPIFNKPIFDRPGFEDYQRQPVTAKLEGELNLHITNDQPGTSATLTASRLPDGVKANLGSYDSRH